MVDKWTVSPDKLTWTFTLRKGVKFQNGEAFTPAAAVYSITRAVVPTSKTMVWPSWGRADARSAIRRFASAEDALRIANDGSSPRTFASFVAPP